jgi:hypothetical protein
MCAWLQHVQQVLDGGSCSWRRCRCIQTPASSAGSHTQGTSTCTPRLHHHHHCQLLLSAAAVQLPRGLYLSHLRKYELLRLQVTAPQVLLLLQLQPLPAHLESPCVSQCLWKHHALLDDLQPDNADADACTVSAVAALLLDL